jgi:molecular chaperone IbpA
MMAYAGNTGNNKDLFPFRAWMVGFDRQMEMLENMSGRATSYPPYNIIKVNEDNFKIEVALAGFTLKDITVEVQPPSTLVIEGNRGEESNNEFLHRGIGGRAFKQNFALAEYVVVDGASFKDGILTVSLSRELPEEQRVKKITIKGDTPPLTVKKQFPEKDWTIKRPKEYHEPSITRTKKANDIL